MMDHPEDNNSPSMPSNQPAEHISGRLLSGRALMEALKQPNHIFRDDSWDSGQIHGAGYDLRLAGDLLVYPSKPGSEYKTIERGEPEVHEFTLAPGDSALISTIERFSLDFNVTANIGPKFTWAAKGLLILQGTTVHPGYGRKQNTEGEWVPDDDEEVPLYFVVTNNGPEQIFMERGKSIAYMQIFEIAEPEDRKYQSNLGFDHLKEKLFSKESSSRGLGYFREWNDFKEQAISRIETLDRDIKEASNRIERVNNATDMVVVFGIFLVAVTILGITLTSLTSMIGGLPSKVSNVRWTIVTTLAVVYSLSCIIAVVMVAKSARTAIHRNTGGDSQT